jgi:hypothetical protein
MELTRFKKIPHASEQKRIRLLVSGFGLQQMVAVDDIVNSVASLPIDHIKRLKVIKYDPNKNISFLIRHQRVGPQLGEYLGGYDSIVIYHFSSVSECYHVLMHEIGHHVYFRTISSTLKKQWVTQVYRSEPAVTKMGERNACEDFAEAYALYVCQPERLNKTPRKRALIQGLF